MVSTYADDFSVTWTDPADANLTWGYDPMHFPQPMCNAMAELWEGVYAHYMSAHHQRQRLRVRDATDARAAPARDH